jgi:general secretion pathway protein N
MMRSFAIGLILLGSLILDAAASATAVSSDALDADVNDAPRSSPVPAVSAAPAESVTAVHVVAPPAAPARTPSANPLWAIPLSQLSETRDRPIFSPSRRPPPVAAAAVLAPVKPPPRKKEVRPPQLSLVGTIASEDESFGIFLDQSSKVALRLKVGEDYQGWKLQAISGREVTMQKDEQAAVLTLPEPGESSSGSVHLIPVNEIKMPQATQNSEGIKPTPGIFAR